MTNKQLQEILKPLDENLNIYLDKNLNHIVPENILEIQALNKYIEPNEHSLLTNVNVDYKSINLQFLEHYITILEPYYFYLRWREEENLKQKQKILDIINTIDNIDLKNKLKLCLAEEKINCKNYLKYATKQ